MCDIIVDACSGVFASGNGHGGRAALAQWLVTGPLLLLGRTTGVLPGGSTTRIANAPKAVAGTAVRPEHTRLKKPRALIRKEREAAGHATTRTCTRKKLDSARALSSLGAVLSIPRTVRVGGSALCIRGRVVGPRASRSRDHRSSSASSAVDRRDAQRAALVPGPFHVLASST